MSITHLWRAPSVGLTLCNVTRRFSQESIKSKANLQLLYPDRFEGVGDLSLTLECLRWLMHLGNAQYILRMLLRRTSRDGQPRNY